jgi:hypothetical protein
VTGYEVFESTGDLLVPASDLMLLSTFLLRPSPSLQSLESKRSTSDIPDDIFFFKAYRPFQNRVERFDTTLSHSRTIRMDYDTSESEIIMKFGFSNESESI